MATKGLQKSVSKPAFPGSAPKKAFPAANSPATGAAAKVAKAGGAARNADWKKTTTISGSR